VIPHLVVGGVSHLQYVDDTDHHDPTWQARYCES
jgi:hypothetical protein